MTDTEEALKRAAELYRRTCPSELVPSKYVDQYCPTTNKPPERFARAEFVIPIISNPSTTADTKREFIGAGFDLAEPENSFAFALKLIVAAIENGSSMPELNIRPGHPMYSTVIKIIGNKMAGYSPKSNEQTLLDRYTSHGSHYINFADHEAAIVVRDAVLSKGQPNQPAAAAPPLRFLDEEQERLLTDRFLWDCDAWPVPEGHQNDNDAPQVREPAAPEGGEAQDAANIFIQDDKVAKFEFSMTNIPAVRKNESRRFFLARFIARDPSFDFAGFINHLITHVLQLNNPKAYNNTQFRNYIGAYGTGHPVYTLNKDRYLRTCCDFSNTRLNRKEYEELCREWPVGVATSPIAPERAFSLENALRVLTDAGANPMYMQLNSWKQNDVLTWPRGLVTFTYPPEQLFWMHPTYLGLSELTFPNVGKGNDFYRSMLDGGDLDDFVDPLPSGLHPPGPKGAPRQGGAPREAPLEDDFIDFERVTRIINRSDLRMNRLLRYETENRLVHFAAARDKLYQIAESERPAGADEIYRLAQPYIMQHRNAWLAHISPQTKARYFEFSRQSEVAEADFFTPAEEEEIDAARQREREMWHLAIEAADPVLYMRVLAYERYAKIIELVQEGCMQRFLEVWKIKGRLEGLSVPDPIVAALEWIQKNLPKNGIITRRLTLPDPNVSHLLASQIRRMDQYSQVARVVQPFLPLITEGLFSCHDHIRGALNFHIIAYGRYDLGKSWQLLTVLTNWTAIDGVVITQTRETRAAADTGKHLEDVIVTKDEVPKWYVNKQAAERDPEAANAKKLELTSKQSKLKAMAFIKDKIGNSTRTWELITTDNVYSEACVTNEMVEATSAITSRFFTFVMKDVGVSATDKEYRVDDVIKADTRRSLQTLHYHTIHGKKAAQAGAIFGEIEMSLFEKVWGEMRRYLESHHAIHAGEGNRATDIIRAFMRQIVYHDAFLHTYDVPGSPHYMQPHNAAQIRAIQPLLYTKLEHILFAIDVCGRKIIDDDKSIFATAALRATGIRWEEGQSAYDMFVNQHLHGNKLPFRRVYNPNFNKETDERENKYMIDLNYVSIKADSISQACQLFASYTQSTSGICASDLEGILNQLLSYTFQPPRNGYEPMPEGEFRYYHCREHDRVKDAWEKPQRQHPDYDGGRMRIFTEDDVPPLRGNGEKVMIHAAKIDKLKSGKIVLHIAPTSIEKFKRTLIYDAFEAVTMSANFPRQKMMLGCTTDEDPSLLNVANYTDRLINAHVNHINSTVKFPPGKDRTKGIIFARSEFMGDVRSRMLLNTPFVHSDDPETQSHRYKAEQERYNIEYDFIEDLEEWSALQQHVRTGMALDAPVQSPRFLRERYDRAMEQPSEKQYPNFQCNYPVDILRGVLARKKAASPGGKAIKNGAAASGHAVSAEFIELRDSRSAYNLLEKEEEEAEGEELEIVEGDWNLDDSTQMASTMTKRKILHSSDTGDGIAPPPAAKRAALENYFDGL